MSPGKKTGTVPKQKKCTNKVSGAPSQKPTPSRPTPNETANESTESNNVSESSPVPKTEFHQDRAIESSWPRKGGGLVPLLESSEVPSPDIVQPGSSQSGPPYFSVLESYRQFAPRLNLENSPSLNVMSDHESDQSSTSNASSWQVIPQKILPEKGKNKATNVTSLDCSVASGSQELTPQVLEARDEQLSRQHARIEKEIQDLLKKTVRIQFVGEPVDGLNVLGVGVTPSPTDTAKNDLPESETDDLDEALPPALSDELLNDLKAKQDFVNELHAKAAYYGALANEWTGEVLFPDQENNEEDPSPIQSVEAMDMCEDDAMPSSGPHMIEPQSSDEINICHRNQLRKPDNIGLSLGFQRDHSREIDRKLAAIKEMNNVLNQVRGMRARGEIVPSAHFEQMAELASETRFQPEMTSLEDHVPDLLPNWRNDLLNNEGTSVPQRSHLPPPSEQNVSLGEASGSVDHAQTTNLHDARVVDSELRSSSQVDRRVAQVDLEHKKKILEELMRKDQGLISAANQDNKMTQDKASAQIFTRHCGDRTSSAAEQDPSPRNSREEGLDDALYMGDFRSFNNAQVEPGSWGSSISRVMEQWLSDGRVCLGTESRPTHSPVDSNHHRIQQGRRHTNQSRDSCSEEHVRNLNVVPAVANRHPQQTQSPQTNAGSQYSPMNVPNTSSDDSNTILILQRHIQRLERQLQNAALKDDVSRSPNLAASNMGRVIPQVGSDNFYQQMLAASQLQQSQLLAMSMNYCHQTIWQQQQELSRLSAVVSSMQGTNQENYSPPVPLGQGVVFTSEATIPQPTHERPQSNLARNSAKPTHQVPADIQSNGGISNARSLPNLYPPLSPVQAAPQRNNNRYQLPQYEPRLQMTSDLFPPFAFSLQNNLPTPSPMLDQGATTALNNQVPPGNRANNYWDNFRSYSRQNLLSGNTKTNEVTSVPSVYPIADRMVNTVHNTTQTQSTQTQTTQPTQPQVRYSTSQKRNLNMHEPDGLIPNADTNKYSPNTRQDVNRIVHRQTRGPYNDTHEIRHARNRAELLRSCPPVSVPESDSSEELNIIPETSSDEDRPCRRRRLISQNIDRERLKKQIIKQPNRVSDRMKECGYRGRTELTNAEDPPPAYETITNNDDLLPQHWQRIRDPSGDTMAALSFVAEYLARNEQSIIDPPRIQELVYNVHDRMLHLCNMPQSKWETQHLQNFLATLKQELICFIGKKCLDVTSKILANMKSNLFGCFEFSTPDMAIQSEACASTSNTHWDPESAPTTSGQDINHFSTETSTDFHRSSLEPANQLNNDRDLAEADQSYSDSFWTIQGQLSPILFNTRLGSSLIAPSLAAQSSPQAASQSAADDTEINVINLPAAELLVSPPQESLNNSDMDQVDPLLSESHHQPRTEQQDDLDNYLHTQ